MRRVTYAAVAIMYAKIFAAKAYDLVPAAVDWAAGHLWHCAKARMLALRVGFERRRDLRHVRTLPSTPHAQGRQGNMGVGRRTRGLAGVGVQRRQRRCGCPYKRAYHDGELPFSRSERANGAEERRNEVMAPVLA
jgi:hypothetical protein